MKKILLATSFSILLSSNVFARELICPDSSTIVGKVLRNERLQNALTELAQKNINQSVMSAYLDLKSNDLTVEEDGSGPINCTYKLGGEVLFKLVLQPSRNK